MQPINLFNFLLFHKIILSLDCANIPKKDYFWYVITRGEFKFIYLFDLSYVEAINGNGIQIIFFIFNLTMIWKKS